ncbi:hypothetical protein DJ84_14695 [Halorubrum ezzemoulense]|nr:hypothetical protein DJ84_14695 [Halorubrum ezzemoulense]
MTAPYQLRDALGDRKALLGLIVTVLTAIGLGLAPAYFEDPSVTSWYFVAYVAVFTAILLVNMHTTDRRLREVSAS